MDEISVLQRTDTLTERRVRTNFRESKQLPEEKLSDTQLGTVIAEGGESFFDYLDWLGLARESNMLVLPSGNHYYFDRQDLKDVTTLVNLKKLNLINHLDEFLVTIYNVLSPKTNFIGCFSDRKTNNGASLTSRLYKKFINFIDFKIDFDIDRKELSMLLASKGFKIIDMTEINGLTYFRTQN